MTLDKLKAGEKAVIKKLNMPKDIKRRFQELGIIPNTLVECLSKNPPYYKIRQSSYALRKEDCQQIEIIKIINGD